MILYLDSGPLGRLVEGDQVLAQQLRNRTERGALVQVPPVVRTEMYAAAGRSRTLRNRLDQVLRNIAGTPITVEQGTRAGKLLAATRPSKRPVSMVDALLAAAAEAHRAVLLTDDVDDFARLRDEAGARVVFARP
ncbi:MAG: hypothetical protein NVS3B24_17960 [Candidatus Dormibacteria bacterium]